MRLLLIATLLVCTTFFGVNSFTSQSKLSVDKKIYLASDYVNLTASNLQSNTLYQLEAIAKDDQNILWKSSAAFLTDKHGVIDFSQIPQSGTYQVSDTQGLFWSMAPEKGEKDKDWFAYKASMTTQVNLALNGTIIDSLEFTTMPFDENLSIVESRTDNAYYDLIQSKDTNKLNGIGIVLLGGSEGGLHSSKAKLIASKGFTVFNLAYFGVGGLPKDLINVPLDYVINNIKLFKANNPHLKKVVLWGGSKGAELALLTASMIPGEINGVIASVPSNVVWQGISQTDFTPKSSWQIQNNPLTFAPIIFDQKDFVPPIKLRLGYERTLQQIPDLTFAEIPVEKINGPILLISGTDDQVWPSSIMAEKLEQRLRKNSFKHKLVNLIYKDAGHWISTEPASPKRARYFNEVFYVGGNVNADGLASSDSTKKIFEFLAEI